MLEKSIESYMAEIKCEYCGKTVQVKKSRAGARFCSNECYHSYIHKAGIVTKNCKMCGKEFQSKLSSNRIFCSRKCYNEFYKGDNVYWNKKDRVKVTCQYCGKEEYVIKSRAEKYKYCSKECESKARTLPLYKRKLEERTCPICGEKFITKLSSSNRRVCCSRECDIERKKTMYLGSKNPNFRGYVIENGVKRKSYERYADAHKKIVYDYFGMKMPSSYHIHHKDADPSNNNYENLVVLPSSVHMLIHRWFGNILLHAITHNKIDRNTFFSLCTKEQGELYNNIIDLNITNQAVVKQGELLESLETDNQQPSIYRNIYVGSTTNSRDLASNVEVGNADTSALPTLSSEDIV